MKYVLDTNIITAIIKGNTKVKQKAQKLIIEGKGIFINAVSYYEIKRGLLAINATSQLKRFELLCKSYNLLLFNNLEIFDIASEIYAYLKSKGQLIGDADILIASIVLYEDFILVSHDDHYNRIEGLKLEDWLNE